MYYLFLFWCKVSASRMQSNLFELLRRRLSSQLKLVFDCKGTKKRNIFQISCEIQKIYLKLIFLLCVYSE